MKARYFFFGLIVLLYATPYLLPGYIASHPSYLSLTSILLRTVSLIAVIVALYLIGHVERSTIGDVPLTRREKLVVIVTEFLAPIIAAGFYYYCWKSRLPSKARQANMYQWIIFGVGVLVVVASWLTKR